MVVRIIGTCIEFKKVVINIDLSKRIKLAATMLRDPTKALMGAVQTGEAPKNLLDAMYTISSGLKAPTRSEYDLLKAYTSSPFLRQSVSKVAKSFASVEWKCYIARDGKDGKYYRSKSLQKASFDDRQKMVRKMKSSETLEELENHPLGKLLEQWNPWLDGNICRQLVSMYYDLVGNSFSIIERNNRGMPIELWPIPSTWVMQTPGFYQRFFKVEIGSEIFDIPESEIIWIKDANPVEPYGRGIGLAKSLADELDTDEYTAKYLKQFFYNDAKPPLLISPKGDVPIFPEDVERLEKQWLEKVGGFWNKFKPYFMQRAIDVKELTQSFQHMQLVELRDWEKSTIREIWGIPPEILGDVDNSNRATIESADYIMAKHVLVPRLEIVRNVLQEKLAAQFDEKIILDYVNPVPEDKEFTKQIMQNHPYWFMGDEIREAAGLDPLPNGEGQKRVIPAAMVFSDEINYPQTIVDDVDEPKEPEKPTKSVKKQVGDEIVYQLLEAIDPQHISYYVHPRYVAILEEIAAKTFADLAVTGSFNLLNPRVQDYVNRQVGLKIKNINQTTIDAIRETLFEGIKAGEGIAKLAKRISSVFEDAKGRRAKVIARTETMTSVNYATFEAYRQSGVVEGKEWVATPDERVRDWHLDMQGQQRKLEEMFESGKGNFALHPGGFGVPEDDVQCRCTLIAIIGNKSLIDTSNDEIRNAYWKTMDATAFGYERAMSSAYIKGFQAQQNAVMEVLKNYE